MKLQSRAILDSSKHIWWLLPWYSVYHHHHEFGDWHVDMSMKDQLELAIARAGAKLLEENQHIDAVFFFPIGWYNKPLHFSITVTYYNSLLNCCYTLRSSCSCWWQDLRDNGLVKKKIRVTPGVRETGKRITKEDFIGECAQAEIIASSVRVSQDSTASFGAFQTR